MSKVETTSKVSLELTTRMSLRRRGARAKFSILDIVHKAVHSLERFNGLNLIDITPFKFSYWIGLLFPSDKIFFGIVFVTDRALRAPIIKVIRGVSDSYRSTAKA